MANLFKGYDVLDIAIQLEKMGHDFYKSATEKMADAKVKELLEALVEDELSHVRELEEIIASANFVDEHTLDEELHEYITELLASRLFTCAGCLEDMLKQAHCPKDILDVALRLKKDAILLYTELTNYIEETDKEVVDRIINQEKQHMVNVASLKRQYT